MLCTLVFFVFKNNNNNTKFSRIADDDDGSLFNFIHVEVKSVKETSETDTPTTMKSYTS